MNKHTQISYIKSVVRITGYFCLIPAMFDARWIVAVATLLIAAEVLGIYEEAGLSYADEQ